METKEGLEAARQEVRSAQYARIRNAIANARNEVLEMIAKVAEKFITTRETDSFESLAAFTADRERRYQKTGEAHLSKR